LFAVIKAQEIIRENHTKATIVIAFNPILANLTIMLRRIAQTAGFLKKGGESRFLCLQQHNHRCFRRTSAN